MPDLYIIKDYKERYKPYDKAGRDLVNATWVKLPAKPKGDGLRALLEEKRGLEVFAIWCLLLEKTTTQKAQYRGQLLNHKDKPASIYEISCSIGLKNKTTLVKYALTLLTTIGWLQCPHNEDTTSTEVRKSSEQCSVVKSSVVKSKYSPTSNEVRLSNLLLDEIQKRKPNFREPNIQLWAKHIDLLLRRDKRTPKQIAVVIYWCQQDDFWQNNILSTEKLRKQIDKLELGMQKNGCNRKTSNNRRSSFAEQKSSIGETIKD